MYADPDPIRINLMMLMRRRSTCASGRRAHAKYTMCEVDWVAYLRHILRGLRTRTTASQGELSVTARARVDESMLDDLYAGTLDEDRWNRAIVLLGNVLGSSGGTILAFNPVTGSLLREEGYGFDGWDEKRSRHREWLTHEPDPRYMPMVRAPVLTPCAEWSLMRMNEWRSSKMYKELLTKIDCAYFLCTWLHKSPNRLISLNFQHTRAGGPVQPWHIQSLKPLLPHITSAFQIKCRMDTLGMRELFLGDGLDKVSFGVLLLDEQGVLLEANGAGLKMVNERSALYLDSQGTLRLQTDADRHLRRWVVTGLPPEETTAGLINVERRPGSPVSIQVSPVSGYLPGWFEARPRWVVLVFDPRMRECAAAELIAKDLGLSEREGLIAAMVASGVSPEEVSRCLNVSINTVRTHLKSVYTKAGVQSQPELARRVAAGPAGAEVGR